MTNYRRSHVAGASYFFTVNCSMRHDNQLLVEQVDLLRTVFHKVKTEHPFHVDAIVILPDHLHCIWTLPPGDANYKTRWALIKAGFSRQLPVEENRSLSRVKRGERGIWQRRYWEHLIRDEQDYRRHVDYIHWNPVKHGAVKQVIDWPYSSFHKHVHQSIYPVDWVGKADDGEFGDE